MIVILRANKGFTLIEMIMVVIVFGVVLAIASPSFITYRQNTNFREAVEDFASDIALYKQRAAAENINYQIVLDKDANSYSVQRATIPNPGPEDYADLVPPIAKSPGAFSNQVSIFNITFTGTPRTIIFNPRGTIKAGTVTLQHTGTKRTADITTNLTGRINVQYKDAP